MCKKTLVSFAMYAALLVVFLGLINAVFNLGRFAFFGELLILLGLLGLGLVAVVGLNSNFSWSHKLLAGIFTLGILDLLFIKIIATTPISFFKETIIAALAGLLIALFSMEEEKPKQQVKKTHKPGKYIASKSGSKYHAPKCDWAKKIKKQNAVWFNSKAEAKKAGYKLDSCVN